MQALKIIGKIFLHFIIILLVTFSPAALYDAVSSKGSQFIWLPFVFGVLAYFSYILYWLLKIKQQRVKSVLIYLAVWIAGAAIGVVLTDKRYSLFIFIPPILVLSFTLLHSFRQDDKYKAISARYALLILTPLTLAFSAFAFYAVGMASIGNMRY